jgi:hypothetical protein
MPTLFEDVRQGAEAQRVLDDPTIIKAFADVEAAIHAKWAASPLRDKDGQYELRLMLKLLGDVRANLERAVSDGKLAAQELQISEQRKSPIQKLRSIIR